jgi:glycosyltransferase involved in cell wall biosynthesis
VGYEKNAFAAIAAMDIFLLTSRAEGLPNVLVEAQALGTIVVTTDVGGASETIERGKTGWILESEDPEYAANLLVRLIFEQEKNTKEKINAREFVKRAFSADRMIDELVAIYGIEKRNKTLIRS